MSVDRKLDEAVTILRPFIDQLRGEERNENDSYLLDRFGPIFNLDVIDELSEEDFRAFTTYKENRHWTGVNRQNGRILGDFSRLKETLKYLLNEDIPVEQRIRECRSGDYAIKGLGQSLLTAVLITAYPEKYCVNNGKVRKSFELLGLDKSLKDAGKRYSYVLDIITKLKTRLECSYLDIDGAWHLYLNSMKDKRAPKLWKVSPGSKGFDFENQKSRSVVAIGWDAGSPLDEFDDLLEPATKVSEEVGKDNRHYIRDQYRYLYEEMAEGDFILYYAGYQIIGLARLRGEDEYSYCPDQPNCHQRAVDFVSNFRPFTLDEGSTVRKTLSGNQTIIPIETESEISEIVEMLKFSNPRIDVGQALTNKKIKDRPKREFTGYSDRSFELLAQFKKSPVKETYEKHESEFKEYLRKPTKHLMASLARDVEELFGDAVETKVRVLSRIQKNDYGKGGIHSHYWGAFYDARSSRRKSSQLFTILRDGFFRCGFGFGLKGDGYIERLLRNMENGEFADEYFNNLKNAGMNCWTIVHDPSRDKEEKIPLEYERFLAELKAGKVLAIGRSIPQGEAVSLGSKLEDQVRKDFFELSPLMAMSVLNDPEPVLTKWSGEDSDDEEDGAEPVVEERITWEDFLDEMTWSSTCPEAGKIDSLVGPKISDHKRNLILFGPPGTGKTHCALRLAKFLATTSRNVKVVQFHQSYSYEHFIEGIKPKPQGSQITYEVTAGPFVEFCRKAQKRPREKFVFIVDEINRGNLSRIFGELMYLLEYRNEEIQLMYSKEPFKIPENVYLVGTMNSADRSIALVDYALRRRFSFVEMAPSSTVIKKWYQSNTDEHQTALKFFEILNGMIGERDKRLAIGHSYFLSDSDRQDGLTKARVKEIWDYSLQPLLEEYFCNIRGEMDRYIFSALWKRAEQGDDHSLKLASGQ